MSFISYAQNFEDVMLWRALQQVPQGFYIDVGANDPEVDSVTKAFYDRGWHGINIEPVPQWFSRLEQARPRDLNLQVAVADKAGEMVLYELPSTGLSTGCLEIAQTHAADRGYAVHERVVPVETLTAIYQRAGAKPVHFLKIDVEGFEQQVLEGIDFSVLRPWILVVESTRPLVSEQNHHMWEPVVLAAGYVCVYFDGLNRYYLAPEQLQLLPFFATPPNVFDDFALSGEASNSFSQRLRQRLGEAEARTEAAEAKAEAAEAKAEAAETKAEAAETKAEAAETKAEAAETKAAEARVAETRVAETRVQALEADLQAVLKSRSWRITAPLRAVAGGLQQPGLTLRNASNHALHGTINALQKPLSWLIGAVLRRPQLSLRINQWLVRYPALNQQLLGVARRGGVIPGASVYSPHGVKTDAQVKPELANLTPRARQICTDLQATIENKKRSS